MTSRVAKNRSRNAEKKTFTGLPRAFPASVVEFVDQDYFHKLSPQDQEWLIRFNDKHYGANFAKEGGGDWTQEQRRDAYRHKNYANADSAHMVKMRRDTIFLDEPPRLKDDKSGEPADFEIPSPEGRDNGPTPEYLNFPEYKARLAAFRDTLDPSRSEDPPKKTPNYFKAEARLNEAVSCYGGNEPVPDSLSSDELDSIFPMPVRRKAQSRSK